MQSLAGVRVIEFCEIAAGPFCGMLLADQGAEVVKVERPDGDAMRGWPPLTDGYSENFASINRGKRSVVLDLKTAGGRDAAEALILSADVVLENFRPGVMARLGLDHESLAKKKPDLITCSISAFGQTGPRSGEGGFDLTMQAMSGIMSVTGEPGAAPVKCGVPLCDFVSGLYGAFSIASALRSVRATGKGQHIDVSMLGASLAVAALQTSEYFGTGHDPKRLGSAHPRNAPYQAFRAGDGFFGMAAGNNKLWKSVCDVVGLPELADDPRFDSPSTRAANQDDLRKILEDVFVTQSAAHWLRAFGDAGVPCSPINTYSEALADPQVAFMGWVQEIDLPNGARTRTFGPPVRVDHRTMAVRSGPPALGADTEDVLSAIGFPSPADRAP